MLHAQRAAEAVALELAYALDALWNLGEILHGEWCQRAEFSNCPDENCASTRRMVTE